MMQEYVAGLLFTPDRKWVALVRKNKPAWQVGLWNAIGGKIEPGEHPQQAMDREFLEEAGVIGIDWQPTAVLTGDDFVVHFFHAFDWKAMEAQPQETEHVRPWLLGSVLGGAVKTVPNLPLIIAIALDDTGIRKPVALTDDRSREATR